jgi:histidyl-tRNA synthetase
MGLERLVLLLQQQPPELPALIDVYVMAPGQVAAGMLLAETLRDALPALAIEFHSGGGSLKSQMKKADKSGAQLAIIVAEDELARGGVTLKPLRDDGPQVFLSREELTDKLTSYFVGL